MLHLMEFKPDGGGFTGRHLKRVVTYILRGPGFGVEAGHVIMSISNSTRRPSTPRLLKEDIRNLKEASGRRGYALPRMNADTGIMNGHQWKSWRKLEKLGLAHIEPAGGEAEDLVITDKGRAVLKRVNQQSSWNVTQESS